MGDEGFIVIGIILVVVVIVLPIGLFFAHLGLRRKVRDLETEVWTLRNNGRPISTTASTPVVQSEPVEEIDEVEEPEDIVKMPEETEPEEIAPVWVQRAAEAVEAPESETPKAFVFKEGLGQKVSDWLQKNWFFAVAAVSLALAGVFLVQYGVENGLLSPARRVMGAIILGAILIGVGEYVRRKMGSDEEGAFELLPSAFSGAGLVSMFAGILAARMMYELIEAGTALFGLVIVGALAIVLGWFYGPLLAIMGVLGALAAPFMVGGGGSSAYFLYFFFAGVAGVGLAIDSYKRWAWLSVLGLIGAYCAAFLLSFGIGQEEYFILFGLITAALAVIIPMRKLVPVQDGAMLSGFVFNTDDGRPEFPTRVAGGAFIGSLLVIASAFLADSTMFWPALAALALMFLAAVIWMRDAEALADLVFLPAAGMLALLYFEPQFGTSVWVNWVEAANRPDTDFAPATLAILLGGSLGVSSLFAWRSWNDVGYRLANTIVAAAFASLAAVLMELFWHPQEVLGSGNWALYLAVLAAAMTLLAERFSRKDGDDRLRAALFALSAMSLISFMAFVMLGSFALTIAIAVLVAAAAWLGRQFNLPLMDRYVQIAAVVVSWRLVIDPGVWWGFDADLWRVLLVYVASIGLLVAAYLLRRKEASIGVPVVLESAIWSMSGVFGSLLLIRYFEYINGDATFLYISILGLIWWILSANQLYRIRDGMGLRRTRIALASIYAALGTLLVGSAVLFNPMTGFERQSVAGIYVFDSLFAAYILPAALLTAIAWYFKHLPKVLRKLMGWFAGGLLALYIVLEIRRWWHGDVLSGGVTSDGELYSYTVAMLFVSVVLLGMAFMRRSPWLRKLALVGIGLTVAKVFLMDVWGLDGLLRVVSVLVLGLIVAALALVNRIMQKNEAAEEPEGPELVE